jgi:ELP3 family radical SAM enzyme/protein acetyltransferase
LNKIDSKTKYYINANLTNNMNIAFEDLFLNKSTDISLIQKNMPVYKQIIHELYKYVNRLVKRTNSEVQYPDCDGKKIHRHIQTAYTNITKKHRVYCKKNLLVFVMRTMLETGELDVEDDRVLNTMWKILQKRPSRNLSGVTVITVLTSPYPDGQRFSCKHNCYYCPNEPDQPRSYLSKEPAVARANRNKFDAYDQIQERLTALYMNGHTIDKLEIILEGGTYTEYPEAYLERFHRDLIYCANTFFDTDKRDKLPIQEEIQLNATAKVRIVGVSIETRPDALVDPETGTRWIQKLREWGVTRIQIGVQHTDDVILAGINRGHTFQHAIDAMAYLKNNGFKVHIHLMPDLPGSTPEKDIDMFDTVFNTDLLQPDEVKIYPCEIVPWSIIEQMYKKGKFMPYAEVNERDLFEVVKHAMTICPPWVRLPRVIRDIPTSYIIAGNKHPNLRQMLMNELEQEGIESKDIRVRESGRHPEYDLSEDGVLRVYPYETTGGTDYFIAYESNDTKCLYGFTRLRIPYPEYKSNLTYDTICEFPVLEGKGLIRELHVYGYVVQVGNKKQSESQHRGIGKQLLSKAEEISKSKGCNGIAVISGIGVTKYYEKLGYSEKETYMVKEFDLQELMRTKRREHILQTYKQFDELMNNVMMFLVIPSFIIMFITLMYTHA